MAREVWEKNTENKKKNPEEYGIFTEWPTPSDIVSDRRALKPMGENKARKAAKDKSGAE